MSGVDEDEASRGSSPDGRAPAEPTLHDAGDPPLMHGRRCRACGTCSFPPDDHGCERCGAPPTQLEAVKLGTTGTLLASTTVHLHPMGHPRPPFVVGVVHLDDGPTVQVWLAIEPSTFLPVGTKVHGVLVPRSDEDNGTVDLAFAPDAL